LSSRPLGVTTGGRQQDDAPSVETPSGKDTAYENFPVGSWLLPAPLRPSVAVYYAFARAIDDISDNPTLSAADKVDRLDGFADALLGRGGDAPGYEKAHTMRRCLDERGITPDHCLDLVAAFKQDATKLRYRDWDDLLGYCILSAAPVGRFLLDLHGGSRHGYGPADALCMALQVINHLQDCRDDYQALDRVYLPLDWMAAEGATVADLGRDRCTPAMRAVIDRTLDATEGLLHEARPLPAGLASRRLAMESAAILDIAWSLVRRLRRGDPLATRIQLSKAAYAWCCIRGATAALFR